MKRAFLGRIAEGGRIPTYNAYLASDPRPLRLTIKLVLLFALFGCLAADDERQIQITAETKEACIELLQTQGA
eukprot:1179331-Prorocentrum_minimum.AAC.1